MNKYKDCYKLKGFDIHIHGAVGRMVTSGPNSLQKWPKVLPDMVHGFANDTSVLLGFS